MGNFTSRGMKEGQNSAAHASSLACCIFGSLGLASSPEYQGLARRTIPFRNPCLMAGFSLHSHMVLWIPRLSPQPFFKVEVQLT